MTSENFKGLKVAIIGSCQVTGLSAAARCLLPGAQVKAWHVGVSPPDSDEELLKLLSGFDTVISQLSDWNAHIPLRISRLREMALPVVYLPTMVFPGFHPDITYIRGQEKVVPGVGSDYHSVIIAAGFALGLPEGRVAALFNAFIFDALGYFDVFDAAKSALLDAFNREGYDLRQLFDVWMRHVGQFMFTLNHPHILVTAALCRLALVRAGYLDVTAPLPEGLHDDLATHLIWPSYPPLARRIGIQGSTMFLRNAHFLAAGETRSLPLAAFISMSYEMYHRIGKDALRSNNIDVACQRLASVVV